MRRALHQIAVGQIAELTGANVKTDSVDVDLDGSVFIRRLVIGPQEERGRDDAVLKAERVYAHFGIGSLLLLRPRLKEITVSDFVFDARCDLDTGRWNIAALKIKAPKGGSGRMPLVRLENGTFQYSKVSKGQVKTVLTVPIEARFEPAEKMEDGYSFDIKTAKRTGFDRSTLSGFWRPGNVIVYGAASSADVAALERAWVINVLVAKLNYDQSGGYSLKLSVQDLLGTQRPAEGTFALDNAAFLRKSNLFTALQRLFNRYRPAGQVDIKLEASGNLQQLAQSTLRGTVYCKDVSICDRKFPYPIKRVVGQIDFTERNAELKNLCGEHGDVKVAINGWSKDFGPKWQYDIKVTSENMVLDDDLYNVLSTRQKKFWSTFSPAGLAAIDYRMVRRSQTDKEKSLTVELLGTEAVYRHFPYPLRNLTGRLLFDRESITFSEVVSQFGGRKIAVNGEVAACNTDRPIYDISVKAENVPLDSTLAAGLSDRQRHLYNRLNMAGLADAEIKIFTSKDVQSPADYTANISLKKTFLKPDDFPLAVFDASGKTVVTRDLINIQNLSGSCGDGTVCLTGRIWPGGETEGLRYRLVLQARQVQLNDDLFCLLPGSLKEIVSELEPKGKINYSADLNKASDTGRLDYRIIVDCLGNSFNLRLFPYPLENVTGTLTITTNSVGHQGIAGTDNVRTRQDATTINITGRIAQIDDAGESRFDLDLENARIFGAETGEKYIDFAGTAKFKGYKLNIRPAIAELDATLKIKALYKAGEGFNTGEAILFANGLKIKGKSLTGLKADIYYDQDRQSWLAKNLITDCYGGKVTGKLEFKQHSDRTLEYLLQVGFDSIDLKQFLGDRTGLCGDHKRDEAHLDSLSGSKPKERFDTVGKMSGSLSLSGQTIGDDYARIGRCRLTITDMRVGKLPLLVKLLSVLKLTEPQDFACDQVFIDSYIKHNRLFFENFDLSGQAIAFNGSGWIDLQSQNTDLVLFARGPRLATAEPSVIESITEGLGHAVVRIEVTGNFCDPQVTTKALPLIEDTLGFFGTKPDAPKP